MAGSMAIKTATLAAWSRRSACNSNAKPKTMDIEATRTNRPANHGCALRVESELIEKGVVANAATVMDTAKPPKPGAATPTRLLAKI